MYLLELAQNLRIFVSLWMNCHPKSATAKQQIPFSENLSKLSLNQLYPITTQEFAQNTHEQNWPWWQGMMLSTHSTIRIYPPQSCSVNKWLPCLLRAEINA